MNKIAKHKEKCVSLHFREMEVAFYVNFCFMNLRHFQKVISRVILLAIVRVYIIGITGSRRPHRADKVSPFFLLSDRK